MSIEERIRDWLETARVRWVMLDAQERQVVLLAALYGLYTLLDVGGTLVKARVSRGA